LDSPLPSTWTPQSKIGFTATIIEPPEYTDSETIIRSGNWQIKMRGYAVIIPGSRVRFVGTVKPKVLGGKVVKIVMKDPTFEMIEPQQGSRMRIVEWLLLSLGRVRGWAVAILEKSLPVPMSSLAAGILLGVKGQMPYEFYQQLVNTGTLHIIAASGFNVMIVASVLIKMAQKLFKRAVAIGAGVFGILIYVLMAGSSASVVRAGIMGSLTLISYYFGRPSDARRLLWITAGTMIMISPLMLLDIGFQLSVAATFGLLYLGPLFKKLDERLKVPVGVRPFIGDYLYPTLAATIATIPIILWQFGRVSWISPMVNMLILPLIPLVMLLGALTLVGGQVMAWIAYVPLAYVVWVIRWFGG
jgi:competence protein ComEC